MNPTWRTVLFVALATLAVLALAIAAAIVWWLPEQNLRLFIDGEQIELPRDLTAGHWLVAAVLVLVGLIVALVTTVVSLLIALGIPLLVISAVMAALALPFVLVIWLLRRGRRPDATSASTPPPSAPTMTP